MSRPTLRHERQLLRAGSAALAAVDEVGRGSLSGPVTVGMVVITSSMASAPQGVRDSKLLSAKAREDLEPRIQRWAAAWSVAHASSREIDELGIIAALRLAGLRALASLTITPDLILLDGSHDYLSAPRQSSLFEEVDLREDVDAPTRLDLPPVVTKVKADLTCASVAAASILAKCARDAIMRDLASEYPDYCWEGNKGYAAPEHIEALARLGPTPHHRLSWKLPGTA